MTDTQRTGGGQSSPFQTNRIRTGDKQGKLQELQDQMQNLKVQHFNEKRKWLKQIEDHTKTNVFLQEQLRDQRNKSTQAKASQDGLKSTSDSLKKTITTLKKEQQSQVVVIHSLMNKLRVKEDMVA